VEIIVKDTNTNLDAWLRYCLFSKVINNAMTKRFMYHKKSVSFSFRDWDRSLAVSAVVLLESVKGETIPEASSEVKITKIINNENNK
jgi:hypothetical protein